MKKLLCLLLAAALVLAMALPVSAAASDTAAQEAADRLFELGLFRGTGTDVFGNPVYDLDRAPTRAEAVTMLVRLLGKEDEAEAGTWEIPFTDVASWAKPYVGFAYTQGLAKGVSGDRFGSSSKVTAAQYLTFVLRALGYDSSTDFTWKNACAFSDQIGLTHGEYSAASKFTRGDAAVISSAALDTCLKGSTKTLLETIPDGNVGYTIDKSGAIPTETGARQLSDSQLQTLSGLTPAEAAPSITTLADAYAWLSQEGYNTQGMAGGLITATYGAFSNGTVGPRVSWVEMSTVINILLEDDYDEVGTLLLAAHSGYSNFALFYISFNYVKCGGSYYVTDPIDHLKNDGTAVYRAHTIKASGLSDLYDAMKAENGSMSDLIMMAVYPLFTKTLQFEYEEDPTTITVTNVPEISYLYCAGQAEQDTYNAKQAEVKAAEYAEWLKKAEKLSVSMYGMPDAIGETTLTFAEALKLVGQEPEVIADRVKTVGDVLQYMIAAKFGYTSPGYSYTPWYGDSEDIWGFDAPGDEQLEQDYGCCCGGYANTVSYLLQGDYDKVGTLRWVGGGNHTISWVMTGGKYYVFDFTLYCSSGKYSNYSAPVTVLDRLEDFYDRMPDIYPKSEVVIMVAYESGAAIYPSRWTDPPAFTGLTFPTEAEGKITVIYQADPDCGVSYAEVTCEIPGWNS